MLTFKQFFIESRLFDAWINPYGQALPTKDLMHNQYLVSKVPEFVGLDGHEAYNQALQKGWIRVSQMYFEVGQFNERSARTISGYIKDHIDGFMGQDVIIIDLAGKQRYFSAKQLEENNWDIPVDGINRGDGGVGSEMPDAFQRANYDYQAKNIRNLEANKDKDLGAWLGRYGENKV